MYGPSLYPALDALQSIPAEYSVAGELLEFGWKKAAKQQRLTAQSHLDFCAARLPYTPGGVGSGRACPRPETETCCMF